MCVLGGSASCSASDSAYSYTFLRSVVCLSVVCHILAPCSNRSTDLDAICQVHSRGPMAHCVRWGGGPWPPGEGDMWNLSQNMQLLVAVKPSALCCHLSNTNDRFRLLPNCFAHCSCYLICLCCFFMSVCLFVCLSLSVSLFYGFWPEINALIDRLIQWLSSLSPCLL